MITNVEVVGIAQIVDLVIDKLTYVYAGDSLIGSYILREGVTNGTATVVIPSQQCCSVVKPTHFLECFGLTGIARAYMRHKLDAYVLSNSGVDRGELYNKGIVTVRAAASTPEVAMADNTMMHMNTLPDGVKIWVYNMPHLGGLDSTISYDPVPIIELTSGKWCSIVDFSSIQQYMSAEDVAYSVDIVKEMMGEDNSGLR